MAKRKNTIRNREKQRRRERHTDRHYHPGKISEYVAGEHFKDRHDRRKDLAIDDMQRVLDWCRLHGIKATVTNNGHHWKMTKGNGCVEWWPSTAKLVFDKRYTDGHHVHDIIVMTELVGQKFKCKPLEADQNGNQ